MKKIIMLLISSIFLFTSCNEELITIVDEYNSPYDIKAIASNNAIYISFWSSVIASDFAGFNLYVSQANTFTQPDDAIKSTSNTFPTILGSNHTRTNFVIEVPTTKMAFANGTLYYVSVTAYGTNNLVDKKYIETKITPDSIIPVIPRNEGDGNGNSLTANGQNLGTINNGKITCNANWKVQYFGAQNSINNVVVLTNYNDNSFDNDAIYSINGLYIFKNGNSLAKIWIKKDGSYRWAYQQNASQWWGI
ncbi:hypothetical protein [Brachyspira sp.]|uniref:hypothetical protein n=1 Tax=Brachyspira sp. TaxID=1977261 RepID=UPI002622A233|nr:hypothetical protein [Brachyspira sp.]